MNNYEAIAYLSKEQAQRFKDFLIFSEINDVSIDINELNDTYSVSVPSCDFEKANNLYQVFSTNELNQTDFKESSSKSGGSIYNNSAEKYSDNLSSAITFLVCGSIGLVILLLNDFNIIHLFNTSGASFILTNVVLGGVFIAFLVIGCKSLKYSKNIKSQMTVENELTVKLSDWLINNISKEMVESSYDEDIPEEMKYFKRSIFLKDTLKNEFSDVDDSVIESVSDNYIEDLFSDK